MALIMYKSSTSLGLGTAGTSITPTIPTSPAMASGDFMVAAVSVKNGATIGTPNGWTKINNTQATNGTSICVALYYRWWQSGDGDPQFTWSGSAKAVAGITVYTGVHATNPIDVNPSTNTGTDATPICSSITTVTRGCAWILAAGCAAVGTMGISWSLGANPIFTRYVRSATGGSSGTRNTMMFADEPWMAAKATGNLTLSCQSGAWAAEICALRPASTATFVRVQPNADWILNTNELTRDVAFNGTSGSTIVVGTFTDVTSTGAISSVTFGGVSLTKLREITANNYHVALWYLPDSSVTGSKTVVITKSSGTSNIGGWFEEWVGPIASDPVDTSGVANGNGTAASVTTDSALYSGQTELVVNHIIGGSSTNIHNDTDTDYLFELADDTNPIGMYFQSREMSGGSTETATFGWPSATNWFSIIAAFSSQARGNVSVNVGCISQAQSALSVTFKSDVSVDVGLVSQAQSVLAAVVAIGISIAVGLLSQAQSVYALSDVTGTANVDVALVSQAQSALAVTVDFDYAVEVGMVSQAQSAQSVTVNFDYAVDVGFVTQAQSTLSATVPPPTPTFMSAGGNETFGTHLFGYLNGSPVYDGTVSDPASGPGSIKCDSGAGASCYPRANNVVNYLSGHVVARFRQSGYAAQTVGAGILSLRGASTTWVLVTMDEAGHIGFSFDGSVSVYAEGTHAVPTGEFYSISVAWNITDQTHNEFRLWLKIGSGDWTQEVTATNVTLMNTNVSDITHLATGIISGVNWGASKQVWVGSVYLDDGADLTNIGDLRVTAKLPNAAGTANDWDTLGGSGANRWNRVSDRPGSDTNYIEQAGSSLASENFGIEGAADGDVDISGATVKGIVGWVRAKTSVASSVPKITVNGTDYSGYSFTTSAATYLKGIALDTYPSAQNAIGMVSTGTADDTYLYECGILAAYLRPASGDINVDVGMVSQAQSTLSATVPPPMPTFMSAGGDETYGSHLFRYIQNTVVYDAGWLKIKRSTTGSGSITTRNSVVNDVAGRVIGRFKVDELPLTGSNGILALYTVDNGSSVTEITLSTTGYLSLHGVTGSTQINANEEHKIALCYNYVATGDNEFRVYLDDSETPEISVSNASAGTGRSCVKYGYIHGTVPPHDQYIWWKDMYVDDGSDLSYPGDICVTAKLPAGLGLANEYSNVYGSGPNRWDYVNDRPLDINNYISQITAASKRENFSIQAADVGDVDLTDATLLGALGWLYGSAGTTGNVSLTFLGTDYTIAITSSLATFWQTQAFTEYPTDTDAIGMATTPGNLACNVRECGVLMAYIPAEGGVDVNANVGLQAQRQRLPGMVAQPDTTLVLTVSDTHAASSDPGATWFPSADLLAFGQHVNTLSPSSVLQTGDTRSRMNNSTDSAAYRDNFFDIVVPETLIVRGNHERNTDSNPAVYTEWDGAFPEIPYHSIYDWAGPNVRFVMFHADRDATTSNFTMPTGEEAWIEARIDELADDWKAVVCCHPPVYGDAPGSGHPGYISGTDRTTLLAYLEANTDKVVAYLAGHQHQNLYSETHNGIVHIWGPSAAPNGNNAYVRWVYDADACTITGSAYYTTTPFGARDTGVFVPVVLPLSSKNVAVGMVSQAQSVLAIASVTGDATVDSGLVSQAQSLFSVTVDEGAGSVNVGVGLVTQAQATFAVTFKSDVSPAVGLVAQAQALYGVTFRADTSPSVGVVSQPQTVGAVTFRADTSPTVGLQQQAQSPLAVTVKYDFAVQVGMVTQAQSALSVSVVTEGGVNVNVGLVAQAQSLFGVTVTGSASTTVGLVTQAQSARTVTVSISVSPVVGVVSQAQAALGVTVTGTASVTVGKVNQAQSVYAVTVNEGGSFVNVNVGCVSQAQQARTVSVLTGANVSVGLVSQPQSALSVQVGIGISVSVSKQNQAQSVQPVTVTTNASIPVSTVQQEQQVFGVVAGVGTFVSVGFVGQATQVKPVTVIGAANVAAAVQHQRSWVYQSRVRIYSGGLPIARSFLVGGAIIGTPQMGAASMQSTAVGGAAVGSPAEGGANVGTPLPGGATIETDIGD